MATYNPHHSNETHIDAVDYDLIEPSKENIQPMRQGRDPKALLRALGVKAVTVPVQSQPAQKDAPVISSTNELAPGRTEATMKSDRKRFEEAIKNYPGEGNNPLAPWMDYIQWTQQSYLTASIKSHLLPLLEKCTRTFLRDARVNQSLSYLKIWFLYMDQVEDCLDMFNFLYTNQVCTSHAKLFEGWSTTFEQRGRTQDALDTLQLGINIGAQPVASLKGAMVRLNARIAKQVAKAVADGVDLSATPAARATQMAERLADENGTTVRQPLGRISGQSGSERQVLFEAPVNGQTVYSNSSAPSNPRPVTSALSNAPAKFSGTSSNFQIFCDESPAPASRTQAKVPFGNILGASAQLPGPSGPQWNEYANASQINKENRAAASSWNAPLHPVDLNVGPAGVVAEGSIVVLPTPTVTQEFPVFQDEECAAEEQAKDAERAKTSAMEGPRKRLDGPLKATNLEKSSVATLAKLQANPLRNMKAAPSASSGSSSSAAKP